MIRFIQPSFFISLFLICKISSGQILMPVDSFGSNPGNLKMFIYGNKKTTTEALPLVVVLHGCGQQAADVAKLTGWNKLADSCHFLILYPQQKLINNPNLCFNWFNNDDINKGSGECESIFEMIEFMKTHFTIDTQKIVITGLSAGGAMSVVMMATHPALFYAGAVFEGGAYKIATSPIVAFEAMTGNKKIATKTLIENVTQQNPTYKGRYPLLIIYQGDDDPIVNPVNATLLINQWTGVHHTDSIADKVDSTYLHISAINRSEYLNTNGQPVVIFYKVKNMGHQLLIKPGSAINEGGQTGLFGVNKKFHSTYYTAKEFGLLKR